MHPPSSKWVLCRKQIHDVFDWKRQHFHSYCWENGHISHLDFFRSSHEEVVWEQPPSGFSTDMSWSSGLSFGSWVTQRQFETCPEVTPASFACMFQVIVMSEPSLQSYVSFTPEQVYFSVFGCIHHTLNSDESPTTWRCHHNTGSVQSFILSDQTKDSMLWAVTPVFCYNLVCDKSLNLTGHVSCACVGFLQRLQLLHLRSTVLGTKFYGEQPH